MYQKLRHWLPILVYTGISFASSLPGSNEWIRASSAWDKLEHFSAYGILGLSMAFALPRSKTTKTISFTWVLLGLGLAPLLAFLDEWHQSFVPGRMSDPMDALSDISGYFFFCLLMVLYRNYRGLRIQA